MVDNNNFVNDEVPPMRSDFPLGAVLLDLEETDLPGVANRVVEYMVANDMVPVEQKEAVVNTLLLRHRHVQENHFSISRRESRTHLDEDGKLVTTTNLVDNDSSGNLRQNLRASFKKAGVNKVFSTHSIRRNSSAEMGQPLSRNASNGSFRERMMSIRKPSAVDLSTFNPETGEGTQIQETFHNTDLLKKIPDGAEATAVLVGAVDFLKKPTIAFVRLAEGVMMDNVVEVPIPVRFLFVLLGPFHGEMDYHEVGRSISTLMSDKHFHEVAYRAHSRGQLLSAINEFLNGSIVLPPAEWSNTDLIPVDQIRDKAQEMIKRKESIRQKRLMSESGEAAPPEIAIQKPTAPKTPKEPKRDPLKRVGRPFYGVYMDLKTRMPLYLSDILDGLNPQVLATAIFIFFAVLSAAITFGGMYADKTSNEIGVGETLLASAINGVIIAAFAAQPLLIIGATGPIMVFDLSLYAFAKSNGLEYLPMRVWISVWMLAFGIVFSAFEGVSVVRYLTRFTEEVFSTLVCLIFIVGAFEKLIGIFKVHPLIEDYCIDDNDTYMGNDTFMGGDGNDTMSGSNDTMSVDVMDPSTWPQPNTALLSLILMFGTFIIAFKLKKFRNSKYLGRPIRRAIGDFGVPIAITVMVLVDYFIKDTYTDKLAMPEGISPSDPVYRGWIINPFGMYKPIPVWVIAGCAPASLLLFVLMFLEENVAQLVLSKPERNMKKGSGFHWDLLLSCVCNLISGIMGAPFMTPAVVRSVSHTSALTIMDTKVAPGESPKIAGAYEQRLSAFVVSLTCGLSIFAAPVLTMVPNAVLYGIFLYMGVSASAGIQFLDRVILFFVPVKYHPNTPYVKQVRTRKMHLFTGIQLMMIVLLWAVKESPAALCFPFLLMILVPLRMFLLPLAFSGTELIALDGGAKPEEQKDEELDFYEEAHTLGVSHEEAN